MNFDFLSIRPELIGLEAALSEIEQAQLVRRLAEDELAYLFKHALVQDTSYSTLLRHERRRLHLQVAQSLERSFALELDTQAPALAEHYWQAEAWEKTVEYALRAGAVDLRFYAVREALAQYERALAALERLASPAPLQEYDALMGWAEAAQKLRPYAEQLEHLARAEQIAREKNDKARLARALYQTGTVHLAQGHGFHSIPPLAEAFTLADELGDERFTLMPTFSMGLAMFGTNPRNSIVLFERAIELAVNYENRDVEATAWSAKAMVHARLGDIALAHQAVEHAQTLLDKIKSPMTRSDVDLFIGWAFFDLGEMTRGLEHGHRSIKNATESANLDCLCNAFDCVGFCNLAAQEIPHAIDAFQEAIQRSQFSGADLFENMGRIGLAVAEYYSGRSEAIADLEQVGVRAQATGDRMLGALVAQQLGGMYAARGEFQRALDSLNQALAFFREMEFAPYVVQGLELLAQVYTQQGRVSEAEQTREQVQEWQQRLALSA